MSVFSNVADRDAIEAEAAWSDLDRPITLYENLTLARDRYGKGKAISFQITSGPKDKSETLDWTEVHANATRAANLFRSLGVGETDTVAYLLPNCNETVYALLGGAVAGIVNPINPLLDSEQIAAILRGTGAKVLVTLKAFPKTDVPQKAAQAVAMAPNVETVLEVDLLRYLTPPKSWIVPLIRPKNPVPHTARVLDFVTEMKKQNTSLDFPDSTGDRVAAYFHTGGTTGMPKVVQHRYSGMIYNGWLGHKLLYSESDNIICPLPLFHVFAVYPVLMSMITSGAHAIFPTPAGYRGEGVFDNFWKLIERWQITFIMTVPTAISALMQRPVNADLSSLKVAFSGSDEDGYLWITGREKDLIIRGGHNIDPALIEEALAGHEAVAFVGAIGQPDAHAGELPCAYVELVAGAEAEIDNLMAHARERIPERAACPEYLEIVDELPKTAVGKVFKPDLRKMAIERIYGQALKDAGIEAGIVGVTEDGKLGLVACVERSGGVTDEQVNTCLGVYTRPWKWAD